MKILKIIVLVFIVSYYMFSCNNQPHNVKDIDYPDWISPIYYVDTFQIVSPRVALIDSMAYIFSLEIIEPFEDKEAFLKQKGVICYLTPDIHEYRLMFYEKNHRYQNIKKTFIELANENKFYFKEMFIPDDSINNIPMYKFAFEPETFMLTLISPIDSFIMREGYDDVLLDITFTNDYFLALAPIYNEQDLKKINELWYRRFHGRDLDWSKY